MLSTVMAAVASLLTVCYSFVSRRRSPTPIEVNLDEALDSCESVHKQLSSCNASSGCRIEQKTPLTQLFDVVPGCWTLLRRPDGSYAMPFASAGFCELFGIEPEDVAEDAGALAALIHSDDIDTVRRKLEESARGPKPFLIEYRILNARKGVRWVEARSVPQRMADGGMRWDGFMYDINERKRMETLLSTRERESRSLAENSPDHIARYDRHCRFNYLNPRLAALLGVSAEELIGKTPSEAFPDGFYDEYEAVLMRVIAGGEAADYYLSMPDSGDGERRYHIRLTPESDEVGEVISVLSIGRDKTEIDAYRKQIHNLAYFDTLTYLPNRALLRDRISQAAAEAAQRGKQFGLMMLDLDRFKEVNDALGHHIGDLLLREATERLQACVRGYDTVARLGGDEFAILLPEIRNDGDLATVANKIVRSIAQPFLLGGRELFVSSSVGIALFPGDSHDTDTLFSHADAAMHHAKKQRGNNFQFYSSELTAHLTDRLSIESALRRALANAEMELYYQPQVNLHSGEIIGAEALLRWNRGKQGMMPPDRFISIAEDTGLIVEIGEWALRAACQAAVTWNRGRQKPLRIAVNLSTRQFIMNDLLGTVKRVLEQTGCQVDWLKLEITESLLLENSDDIAATLEALAAMGLVISIDDFGTGYSALGYLNRFPVQQIKIDKSFVQGIPEDQDKAELIKAMIYIAKSLRLDLVAEGVETSEQANYLLERGCVTVQGYLFGKPLPLAEFERLLNDTPSNLFERNASLNDFSELEHRLLTRLTANLPGFIYTFRRSPDGHLSFPFASEGIRELYGLSPEDVAEDATLFHSLSHPDDRPSIEATIESSAREMRNFRCTFRIRHPVQGERWIESRSTPERELGGGTLWHGVMLDVTEQKRMEQQLTLLNYALDHVKESATLTGEDARFYYVNEGFCQALGYTRDELLGLGVSDIDPDYQFDIWTEHWRDLKAHGSLLFNSRHKHKDGRTFPVEISANYFEFDGKGYNLALMRDVTERRRYEQALLARAKLQERISSVASAVPGFLFTIRVDADGHTHFPFASASVEALFGLRPEDIAADAAVLHARYHPEDLPRIMALMEETERTLAPFRIEIRIFHPQQGERWVEIRSTPQRQEDGGTEWHGLMIDISGRKNTEIALHDSEHMLTEAQRIAHIGSWDWAMVNDRLLWSDEMLRIWEIDRAHFGANVAAFLERVHPDDVERVQRSYNESINNRSFYQIEHRLLLPDGRIKYVLERGEPHYDAEGRPLRFIGTGQDITEHKRYEQSLLERVEMEQRQSQYFAAAPGLFCTVVMHADGSYTMPFASSGIRELFGVEPEDAMRDIRTFVSVGHPDDVEMTFRKTEESARDLTLYHVEYRIVHPQKGLRWVEVRSLPQRMADGGTRWDGFMHDITERKRMEEALTARETELRFVMDSLPDSVARWDVDGRYVYVNTVLERALATPAAGLIGKTIAEAFPDGLFRTIETAIAQTIATGQPVRLLRQPMPEANGETCFHYVNLIPERNVGGQIVGALCIDRDMTDFYRLQDEIVAREQEFRSLVENSQDMILRYDRECRRTYVNPAFLKLISKPPGAMLGGMPSEYFPAPAARAYENALGHAMESGVEVEHEYTLPTGDGRMVTCHIRIVPEWGGDGRIAGVLVIGRDLTERKRMETELRAQMNFHQTLQDAMSEVGLQLMMIENGRIIYVSNRPLAHEFGFSDAELDAHPSLLDIVHPDDHARVMDYYLRRLRGEAVPNSYETALVTRSGERRAYEVAIATVPETDPVRLISVGWDISERNKLELGRQAHLHFFENLDRVNQAIQAGGGLDRMMDNVLAEVLAVFDCDRAYLLYPCDPDADSWHVPKEITRPEYPGALAEGVIVPMAEDMRITLRILLDGDGPETFGPEGAHALPAESSARFGIKSMMSMAVYPKTGKPWHFGIHQCAYVRKWTQDDIYLMREIGRRLSDGLGSWLVYQELQAREREFRSLAESSPGMMGSFYLRPDGSVCMPYASPNIRELFGVRPEDLVDDAAPLLALNHPEDAQGVFESIQESARTMAPWRKEYRILHPTRGERWMEGHTMPEPHPDGGVIWYGYVHDITERKHMEEAARESLEALYEAERIAEEQHNQAVLTSRLEQSQKLEAVGTLAAGIAHDFNNLLGSMIGFAELAGDELPEGSFGKNSINQILTAGLRARDIVARMLTFARENPVDLVEVEVVSQIREALELLSVSLKPEMDIRFQSGIERATVMADPGQVQQIVMNLCINAADAMNRKGTIDVRIDTVKLNTRRAGIADDREVIVLSVADHGTGITPELQKRIFDPFFTTKAPNKGSGLGLSVVYGIVTQLGGEIEVESRIEGDDTGTEFRVLLPLAE